MLIHKDDNRIILILIVLATLALPRKKAVVAQEIKKNSGFIPQNVFFKRDEGLAGEGRSARNSCLALGCPASLQYLDRQPCFAEGVSFSSPFLFFMYLF